MSKYFNRKNGTSTGLESFMNEVDNLLVEQPGVKVGSQIASMEAAKDDVFARDAKNCLEANVRSLEDHYADLLPTTSVRGNSSIESDWIAESQRRAMLESGAIALEMAKDPFGYRSNAVRSLEAFEAENQGKKWDYVADYGSNSRGGMSLQEAFSLEGFEQNNLAKSKNISVAFNFQAPQQEAAVEALMPTIVLTPDEPAFFYEVQVDRFWDGHKHTSNNVPLNFHKNNILAAMRHPDIIRQTVLEVIPVFRDSGANRNDNLFMPVSIRQPEERALLDVKVKTQPLLVGHEYDVLALSYDPVIANGGVFDETDTLDARIDLKNIYLNLKDGEDTAGVIKLDLYGLETRNWVKAVQGHGNDMQLNFRTTEILLDKKTVGVDGATVPQLLKDLGDNYAIRLSVSASGAANVETGHVSVDAINVKVAEVLDLQNGNKPIKLDDSSVKTLLAKFKFAAKYFDLYANRTNANLRTQGTIVDTDVFTAKISIGVRSPIRVQRPLGSSRDYPSVETLLRTLRVRQSADAWHEVKQYRDMLARWKESATRNQFRTPDYFGIGKYFVRPFFESVTFDLADKIKSAETKNNLDNVRGGLSALLQEMCARAVNESQWGIYASQFNGGKEVKPHFVIVTSYYISNLLNIQGDVRLLGNAFDFTVVPTYNEEFDNKILATIVNPENKGFDPLSFGATFVYPEVVTTINPHSMNGATKETIMVTPRYQHTCQLPLMIELNVENVEKFMQSYNVYQVKSI